MSKNVIPLILANVLMTSIAQLSLKAGMSNFRASGSSFAIELLESLARPLVLTGLFIYFLSTLLWLIVLSKADVSFAYPFVGIGFIVTMLCGWWLYGEPLTPSRIIGTLVIVLGIVILAQSGGVKSQ